WLSYSVCSVRLKLLTLYFTVIFAESVPTFTEVISAISNGALANSLEWATGVTVTESIFSESESVSVGVVSVFLSHEVKAIEPINNMDNVLIKFFIIVLFF